MQEDRYYIRCFKADLQDYINAMWDAYDRVYGHLFTREEIARIITRDIIMLFACIDKDGQWIVKDIKQYV